MRVITRLITRVVRVIRFMRVIRVIRTFGWNDGGKAYLEGEHKDH